MLSFLPLDGIMKYEQKPQTPNAPQTRTRLLLLLHLSKMELGRRRRRQPLPLLPAELRREWELSGVATHTHPSRRAQPRASVKAWDTNHALTSKPTLLTENTVSRTLRNCLEAGLLRSSQTGTVTARWWWRQSRSQQARTGSYQG